MSNNPASMTEAAQQSRAEWRETHDADNPIALDLINSIEESAQAFVGQGIQRDDPHYWMVEAVAAQLAYIASQKSQAPDFFVDIREMFAQSASANLANLGPQQAVVRDLRLVRDNESAQA